MLDNCTNVQSSLNTQESSQSSFNYTSADANTGNFKINVSSSPSDNCDNDSSKETLTNITKVTTSPTESEDEEGQIGYRVSHRICEIKILVAQRR